MWKGLVLITGARGMVGRALVQNLGASAVSLGHAELDISDQRAAAAALDRVDPEMLINCAAATDVDRCETDHAYAEKANMEGPRILAEVCAARGIGFVHASTDYVFDGNKVTAYVEGDRPNPVNYYGWSKLQGEEAVLTMAPDLPVCLIVRTSWVYGPGGADAANFPARVLDWAGRSNRLRIACDQWGSPTFAPFLARGIMELLATGAEGVYHLAGDGCASRLEFAQEVIAASRLDVVVEPAQAAEFAVPAPRPTRSCLDCSRAAALGVRLPSWKEGVASYVGALLGDRSARADNGYSDPMTA